MTYPTIAAHTRTMALDVAIARLAAQPAIVGILLMGTTGTAALTPASDYDLLLILAGPNTLLSMVHTWIDERLTEIYCTPLAALDRIVDSAVPWPDRSTEAAILRWLRDGRIAHDSADRLRRAQELARSAPPPPPADEREIYSAWRSIGYNLAQTRRYLDADDPIAQEAVDWRLLHGLTEIQGHYFTIRRLPWRGEKQAVRYLIEHDPAFLNLLRRCIAEADRRRKFAHYEALARLAVAPIGDLWEVGTTIVAPGPGFGAADAPHPTVTAAAALAFWRELIGG